ncbi:MAG: CoA transferase [Deltaproteobacteria bacterium]|nr:MAG: CoA transferase [Deltaproteobacteria bacterium]
MLKDLRILDLTRLLPGPYCTMILADHGARVLKLEAPEEGDYIRSWEPKIGGFSALFLAVNRNKKSLTLNLKTEAGREIFFRLLREHDVVVESFRPGVMERLGIDYHQAKKINDKIIYCSITGYGQFGPKADKAGHDLNYLAETGVLHTSGCEDGRPVVPGIQVADIAGGALYASNAILMAYVAVLQGRKGMHLDISMTDGLVSMFSLLSAYFFAQGQDPGPNETTFNGGEADYQVYRTRDNQYMALGALESKFWRNFCEAADRPDLISRQKGSSEDQRLLRQEVAEIFARRTRKEWEQILEGKNACCEPVASLSEVVANDHFKARKMFYDLPLPGGGSIRQLNSAIMVDGEKRLDHCFPPKLGEHTEEVLLSLGYGANDIDLFRRQKVV